MDMTNIWAPEGTFLSRLFIRIEVETRKRQWKKKTTKDNSFKRLNMPFKQFNKSFKLIHCCFDFRSDFLVSFSILIHVNTEKEIRCVCTTYMLFQCLIYFSCFVFDSGFFVFIFLSYVF